MAVDRRPQRQNALRKLLEGQGLDGLIVTHLPNIRYLTGFSGSAGLAAILAREALFLSDFRYATQAQAELGGTARIEIVSSDLWARLWEVLREFGDVGTVGFESHAVSVRQAERFGEGDLPVRVRPVANLVEGLRASKDAGEVNAIRRAAGVASEALRATLPQIVPGLREIDVAATLESELRRRGSEWHPFPTIVASGPRAALPHARTTDRSIVSGDWVLLDFGAQLDGYCADITRTVVVGRPADERQRVVYEIVRDAQLRARASVRAGMTGKEADAVARSVIESNGFGEAFGHSLGHGLGLEVHEAPRLSTTSEAAIPEGAVVTIEPGIYLPGWGGVRIEDDVHVSLRGVDLLSDGHTELLELS